MTSPPSNESFEYAKSLYASITDWYKDVHGRAQTVLTLDGAFITLLAGVIVLKSEDLALVTQDFGPDTVLALIAMSVSFVLSGAFAISALLPLGLRAGKIQASYDALRAADNTVPAPSVMWWSQFIRLMKRTDFIAEAQDMSADLHAQALTSQSHALSLRLAYKYRLVFAAFVCTGFAILALLYATASYVSRVG